VSGSGIFGDLQAGVAWGNYPYSHDARVYFTGPPGATTVSTRVRYVSSNSASAGGSGPVLRLGAHLHNQQWLNPESSAGLQTPNVTNLDVVSPFIVVPLNTWCDHSVTMGGAGGQWLTLCWTLHLPLNEPVFDLPPGYSAHCPALGIVDNIWQGLEVVGDWNAATGSVACFNTMPLLRSVSGDLDASDTSASTIDFGELQTSGGSIVVSNNPSATEVDFGELQTSGGSIVVSNNPSASEVDFGELQVSGGSIVTGNGTAGSSLAEGAPIPFFVDLSSLTTVQGDLFILDNSPDTTFALGPITQVDGALSLSGRPAGGTLDLSQAAVAGYIIIDAKDADSIFVRTPTSPGSPAAMGIRRDEGSYGVAFPGDSFTEPTVVRMQRSDPADLHYAAGLTSDGQPFHADALIACTIESDGRESEQVLSVGLNLNLNSLPEPQRQAVLDATVTGRLRLCSRVEGKGAPYQAFEACPGATARSKDCSVMQLLDADGKPVPPGHPATTDISFAASVNALQELAVLLEVTLGDLNGDDRIDGADLATLLGHWGPCLGCAADFNGDGVVNGSDLATLLGQWSAGR